MSDTKYNTSPTLINSLLNFPKFAQNIYQCLYPSEPAITPDDIKPISLAGVYNEDPHNDFWFLCAGQAHNALLSRHSMSLLKTPF